MHKRNYFLISLLVFLLALVFVLISVKKDVFLQPVINGVQLTWTDNSNNEIGFKIERSTDGINFIWIADVSSNVVIYIDNSIAPATTYYYRVYAHNLNGNSGFANSPSISTFSCTPSTTRSCLTSLVGICSAGTETCSSTGIWNGICVQNSLPVSESCNALDDDCDGYTDENTNNPNNPMSQFCAYSGPIGTVNVGICSAGLRTCGGGVWGTCSGEVLPQIEVCNNLDDNCNGVNDEGLGTVITCGVGACYRPITNCVGGTTNLCVPGTPTSEICNDGIDNNCNSLTDCADIASCSSSTYCSVPLPPSGLTVSMT